MDKMVKIQEKYGNDVEKFHKDPEFIKLSNSLGRVRRTPIHLQRVVEVKKPMKMRLRSKGIGRYYRITCAMYTLETARIYVYKHDKIGEKFDKYLIGEYVQINNCQSALSLYNSVRTVKDIKKLLQNKKREL